VHLDTRSSPPTDGLSVAQKFSYSYSIRPSRFKNRDLVGKFILNDRDGATYEFLQGCEDETSGFCKLLVNACLQVCRPLARSPTRSSQTIVRLPRHHSTAAPRGLLQWVDRLNAPCVANQLKLS
jgi:hypothetical protein